MVEIANKDTKDKLIKSYITYCCTVENQHEGITKFLLDDHLKRLESSANHIYYEDSLIDFIATINAMRVYWARGVQRYGGKS